MQDAERVAWELVDHWHDHLHSDAVVPFADLLRLDEAVTAALKQYGDARARDAIERCAKVADMDRDKCFTEASKYPERSEEWYRWTCCASASNVVAGLIRALAAEDRGGGEGE